MTTQKLLAALTVASALILPSGAMAGVVLNGHEYPEWKTAELRATCQGLEGRSKESLTTDDEWIEESGDPASNFRLSMAPFTLADCKAAGLI